MTSSERKLSIYVAEIAQFERRESVKLLTHFHAAVMLHDEALRFVETDDNIDRTCEEIHITDTFEGKMTAEVKTQKHHYDGHIRLLGGVGGWEREVLPRWNRGLEMALIISRLGLSFNDAHHPDANNCRHGRNAVVKAMEVDFTPGTEPKMEHGRDCNYLYHYLHQLPPVRWNQSLDELRARKAELESQLQPQGIYL